MMDTAPELAPEPEEIAIWIREYAAGLPASDGLVFMAAGEGQQLHALDDASTGREHEAS